MKVGKRRKDRDDDHSNQRADDAPVRDRQLFLLCFGPFDFGRKVPEAYEIYPQGNEHEKRGRPEAIVPAIDLRQ